MKPIYTWLVLCFLFLIVFSPVRSDLEGLAEEVDTYEVVGRNEEVLFLQDKVEIDGGLSVATELQAESTNKDIKVAAQAPLKSNNYFYEAILAVFVIIYAANYWFGQAANRKRASAWADHFAAEGTVLERNFSLIGFKDGKKQSLILQETASQFKCYASGRRYCQGLLALLDLKPRHDIVSFIWSLLNPTEDTVSLEVYMNEANMPTCILAVATQKVSRTMQRDILDMRYTKRVGVTKSTLPHFPAESLVVLSESSPFFHDIFADARLQQLFNPNGQFKTALAYFRSLYCTTENSEGSYRNVLKFTFALPPAESMSTIAPLMMLVPLMIDLLGMYRMSADLKKKVIDARKAFDEDHKKQEDQKEVTRKEAAEKRRLEKLLAEKERVSRMTPEQRMKHEERQRKQQMKQQYRVKYK